MMENYKLRKTLIVPMSVVRRTHEYFLPYWRAGVETACFWFGTELDAVQVATTVAVPELYQTAGNYRVVPASMRKLATAMREQGLTNLAQIHTHPIDYVVKHSWIDDERGYSTAEGALSIVWADYGHGLSFDMADVGVHEITDGEWELTDRTRAKQRIRIVDDFSDFRWEIRSGDINEHE